MTFQSPLWLLALLVVAALVALYVVLQLRRKAYAARFTQRRAARLDRARSGPAGGGTWRSAWSRSAWPRWWCRWRRRARKVRVPRERATVIMAVDVSLSMKATDIQPARFRAMQSAAKEFVDVLPARINLGLVSFAGTATTLVPPTTDRAQVRATRSTTSHLAESTAIGEAIFTSLQRDRELPVDRGVGGRQAAAGPDRAALRRLQHRRAGRHPGDRRGQGRRRPGVDDRLRHRLRHAQPRRRDGAGAGRPGRRCKSIADETGGSYNEAATAAELEQVYADLGSQIGYTTEPKDISSGSCGSASCSPCSAPSSACSGPTAWSSSSSASRGR